MVVDEWHNNGPQDLITVSLCIQNAINKMHLCSLRPVECTAGFSETPLTVDCTLLTARVG